MWKKRYFCALHGYGRYGRRLARIGQKYHPCDGFGLRWSRPETYSTVLLTEPERFPYTPSQQQQILSPEMSVYQMCCSFQAWEVFIQWCITSFYPACYFSASYKKHVLEKVIHADGCPLFGVNKITFPLPRHREEEGWQGGKKKWLLTSSSLTEKPN